MIFKNCQKLECHIFIFWIYRLYVDIELTKFRSILVSAKISGHLHDFFILLVKLEIQFCCQEMGQLILMHEGYLFLVSKILQLNNYRTVIVGSFGKTNFQTTL